MTFNDELLLTLESIHSQRRVTFHLPDGSQESCSDSGLGDHEPVGSGTLISHPLPLVQPQDEFYDQASPDKRTEADGNSDPNSGESFKNFDPLELWFRCTGEH
ncbi:Protocadherin-9 [Fukomys damarensis]|uniref:Protocadherin-9 n=1 Tax=Fukomys damarensis TaxID=885580 RepID=A0A091E494_FUKDA|nr:Protocadherin-9 [Fukomys damarensis]